MKASPGELKFRRYRRKYLRRLATMPLHDSLCWIDDSPRRTLVAMLNAMVSVRSYNCWWAEFAAARMLMPRVKNRIALLEDIKRTKNTKKKTK